MLNFRHLGVFVCLFLKNICKVTQNPRYSFSKQLKNCGKLVNKLNKTLFYYLE